MNIVSKAMTLKARGTCNISALMVSFLLPLVFVLHFGCSSIDVPEAGEDIESILAGGVRVMWVAAHPDDEAMVGSILVKSSLFHKNPLYMLVLTHGEGGECCRPEGCEPDLATVRVTEMAKVAERYKAELQLESYFNAPLPVESFPTRDELARIWSKKSDPTVLIARAIRSYKPDVVFTFDPHNGFTGHPEHQVASRFTTAAIRMAADKTIVIEELPAHRVSHTYYSLNRYWPFLLLGRGDPDTATEAWPASGDCGNGMECRDVMAEISKEHRSQENDMGTVRSMAWMLDYVYLQKVDPFTEILDPFEPLEK
jgi:LmbE family N-acetylglucosaminyl deacetylase